MCICVSMKTIRVPDKLWERLQKLKLKLRKKSVAEVIEEALELEEKQVG